MKKLTKFLTVFLLALLGASNLWADNRTIFVKADANWTTDNAKIGVNAWKQDVGSTTAIMTNVHGTLYYHCVDTRWDKFQAVRLSNDASSFDWNKKWNQTSTYNMTSTNNCFTTTSLNDDNSEGSWSNLTFKVLGEFNSWSTSSATISLTDQGNGKFKGTLSGYEATSTSMSFKVIDSQDTWYGTAGAGGNNDNYSVSGLTTGATYDIEFTFNVGDIKNISVTKTQKTFSVTASSADNNMGTVSPSSAWVGSSAVTFTATPETGYHWTSWSKTGGASPSNAATSSVTATASGTITANFAANEYAVNFAGSNFTPSFTSGTMKAYGSTVEFTLNLDQDYAIDGVTAKDASDNNVSITNNSGTYSFTMPNSAVTVTVQTHSTAVTTYTIRFLNYNGTVLQEGQVEDGHTPVYSGATPTKSSDTEWDYTFNTWTPTITAATKDQDYTATYSSSRRKYTLTWEYAGGSVVTAGTPAGQVANASAITAPTVERDGYEFTGWNPSVPATMPAGDVTYTAQWSAQTHNITYVDANSVATISNQALQGQTDASVSFNAVLKAGFRNMQVVIKDASNNTISSQVSSSTYTFTMPATDVTVTITATELPKIYILKSKGATSSLTFTAPGESYIWAWSMDEGTPNFFNGASYESWPQVSSKATIYTDQIGNEWYVVTPDATQASSFTMITEYRFKLSANNKTIYDDEANHYVDGVSRSGNTTTNKGNVWLVPRGSSEDHTAYLYTSYPDKVQTYKVEYDANNATEGAAPTDANSPYVVGTQVTVLGNIGNLVRTGYNFSGWNTQANGQGTDYAVNSTFTISQDMKLYAKWVEKKWTVTVAKVGEGEVTPTVGAHENIGEVNGTTISATPAKFYYFDNWALTTGTGSFNGGKFYPTSDATITATFTAYTSSFDVTEANVNVGKTATVTFTKDGHYSDPTITYELWNEGKTAKVTDGTEFENTQTGATFVAQEAGTYTVKAIVKQNETTVDEIFSEPFTIDAIYTVNFAVSPIEKGSITTPAATPKEDVTLDNAFNISASAGTGYHFNKWTAQPKASFTFADSTTAATTVTMTAAAVTSTITANFSPNTYVVKFNANSPTGQQATGKMEDQSFEYDEAAKALTENAFVRLGYNFLGWATTAGGTVAHLDKAEVSNLTSDNGGVVNLYAIWQLKNDCSIEVIAPAVEDGTISPSAKVTGANVEGTVYTYTFEPKTSAVTFMNWTITNAICVDGTNERSNPVKIKTYGEATIRANVKENLVSVTLKVLPNDQWGYFKVNGNNVASGTVINVGEKTTATVLGKNTNFGYKFDGFEYTDGYGDLITYDENTGSMQGKGVVGKVTIIAKFSVDTYTGWELFGNWDNFKNGIEFTKHADQNTKKIAYATKELYDGDYEFILKKGSNWYGNDGTIDYNYSYGWKFTTGKGNCKFKPAEHSGPQTYIFRLDYTDENNPTITMLRQDRDGHWFPEGTTVYFNNHNENSWGRSIIRFGCDGGMAEAYDMTLVPGTANLYSYTFPQGYKYFQAYQIVNNYGWTGAKDKSGETKYGIYNIGEGDYKIGRSTEHLQNAAAPGCVIKIKTDHYKGDYEVEYYKYEYWDNVAASQYTVNFTQTDYTGGTLKVEQLDNNDGSARTTLTNGSKVDQSRYIMITATPKIGYKFVKLTAKMQGWAQAEDHYGSTWKYAVQNNVESITAEFAPVNTYTFYVKNAASTDETWHSGSTKDVYLYYANESGTSYWGWPGLMATPMDNKHEWYKVEMTNAYFDIHHWRLNNGVGTDCPQTDQYATNNGVPEFNSQPMEGKYYELVYDKKGTYETYKLQAASVTPSFYRVVSEDGKYTSNVATEGQIVSFFATQANGAKLQKSGESGWTDVDGGTISITADNVYVATINGGGTGVSTPEVYEGDYYIRTDGASGGWEDYKAEGKNNTMTHFTPRPGETYSYYWIQNLGKGEGSFNVKAKVANDYNDNLAGEIANDANTNIYGNINKTTNGSNVRFSYEPTTNLFERAILSGSADDSYLNIVGANIYSDVSCKSEFALNADTYKTNPKACKLRDISDWVYEMTIYAKVPNTETAIGVDMYSLYNGNRSTLLDGKVIMAEGTGEGTYKLRATYDFKKNRITTSWSPSSQTITETMTVNADIQFLQNEKGDVSQITITQDVNDVTVKSLEYLLYVLEIEDPGVDKRKEEHYRISLPFNCRVSDIYGIENYVVLNDAGNPISGDWGIQKYDGETRAAQGWYDNSPIQNFWKWLDKDDIMYAGQGYSISIDKAALNWSTIGEEVTRTICDANGTNCQDVTTTEDRAAHRLYFPSTDPGFDLANSTNSPTTYEPITCTKTQGNRDIYDSDWRFMGSTAYNNIKTNIVDNQRAGDKAVPEYLYVLNAQETEYVPVTTTDAAGFIFRSFGAYMFQFHGTIAWNIYTQSHPESPVSAPRYSAKQHAPEKMHVDVIEGEEVVAQAFVELNDKATTGFDQKMDLTLMKSSKVARAYTTTEGIDYAANCLPFESTIVPMTVNTLHAGDYTLHLEGADNVAVYLIDYQLQTETLISAGDVAVELEKGSSNNRFALRFDVAAAPTDMQNGKGEVITNDGQKTTKLLRNGNIYLINAGRVYNATGAELR